MIAGACEAGETFETCPADCDDSICPGGTRCNDQSGCSGKAADGFCADDETDLTCPADCELAACSVPQPFVDGQLQQTLRVRCSATILDRDTLTGSCDADFFATIDSGGADDLPHSKNPITDAPAGTFLNQLTVECTRLQVVPRGPSPIPVNPCGNGDVDFPLGEECDDGNNIDGDGCSALCQLECGNGDLDSGEECDDGNTTDGDGCSSTCQIEFPQFSCPCWSQEQIDALHPARDDAAFTCFPPLTTSDFESFGFREDGPDSHPYTVRLSADFDVPSSTFFCFYINTCDDDDCTKESFSITPLTTEEHAACKEEVVALAAARNASCIVTP